MSTRAGVTVAETLVALLLGLLVVQGAFKAAARVRTVHQRIMGQAEVLSSMRLAGALLRTEARHGAPGRDWSMDRGALSLRAFRGTGLVCPHGSMATSWVVSYTGYRRPDPTKDSVLVLDGTGTAASASLVAVRPAPETCGGAPLRGGLTLEVDSPLPSGGVVARVYERGTYSLSAAALRYRRGAGGRQPLTPEVWARESGWSRDGTWLHLVLLPEPRRLPRLPVSTGGGGPDAWRLSVGEIGP